MKYGRDHSRGGGGQKFSADMAVHSPRDDSQESRRFSIGFRTRGIPSSRATRPRALHDRRMSVGVFVGVEVGGFDAGSANFQDLSAQFPFDFVRADAFRR